MRIRIFPGHRLPQMSAAVSVAAQRAPTILTVVRHRSQPAAATIARLTTAGVVAYPLVLALTTTPCPVLAPLTALPAVQASLYQTLRSAITGSRAW